MMFIVAVALWREWTEVFADVWEFINTRFRLGRITVSIAGFAIGVLVLAFTLVFARYLSNFVEKRLQLRSHIDAGLRYTIGRLIRYGVITIGLLLTLKAAFQVDLTSLAVIFTALSVGIGFGLQYLAADIASGFILLFERPIRVGDRITIGEDEGDVESINLRTTIVSTSDRVAIIIPNSKLVSQRVVNWSYADPRARISIQIGVADDSDVDHVTKTLVEAAQGVEFVLNDPPPRVQFMKFGDYSLDFRLLVWTRQPRRHPQIKSDINYRIEKLFRERGIEIPYPVQDLRLTGLPLLGDRNTDLIRDDSDTAKKEIK